VLSAQARQVLRQTEVFERAARSTAGEREPEVALAIDDCLPTAPLIQRLARLQARCPAMMVSLFTEGLGTAQRRVLDGSSSVGLGLLAR
jgi:DNA-binding transcriptional LysR family regulator